MTFTFASLFRQVMRHGDAVTDCSTARGGSWIRGEHSDLNRRPPRLAHPAGMTTAVGAQRSPRRLISLAS